jgi:hypothetical protein
MSSQAARAGASRSRAVHEVPGDTETIGIGAMPAALEICCITTLAASRLGAVAAITVAGYSVTARLARSSVGHRRPCLVPSTPPSRRDGEPQTGCKWSRPVGPRRGRVIAPLTLAPGLGRRANRRFARRIRSGGGRARGHSAEHGEASLCRPSSAVGLHDRAADQSLRCRWRMACARGPAVPRIGRPAHQLSVASPVASVRSMRHDVRSMPSLAPRRRHRLRRTSRGGWSRRRCTWNG